MFEKLRESDYKTVIWLLFPFLFSFTQVCGLALLSVRSWATQIAAGVLQWWGPMLCPLLPPPSTPLAASARPHPCPGSPVAGTTTTRLTSLKQWGCKASTKRCCTESTIVCLSHHPGLSGCRRSVTSLPLFMLPPQHTVPVLMSNTLTCTHNQAHSWRNV